MRKFLVMFLMLAVSNVTAFAQDDLDPAFAKNFGHGVVLAAQTGFPGRTKCEMSQFDFRDGKFFIPSGEKAELNLRAILSEGLNLGDALARLKKEQSGNLQYHQKDFCVFKVWSTHEAGNLRENIKWPASLKEEPVWAEPAIGYTSLDPEVYSWIAPGASYEGDFKSAFWSMMPVSVPGQKLYITFHVGFEYQVPGGQTESKWNSVLEKFENVVSDGMIGYAYSEPLAASTIEFK